MYPWLATKSPWVRTLQLCTAVTHWRTLVSCLLTKGYIWLFPGPWTLNFKNCQHWPFAERSLIYWMLSSLFLSFQWCFMLHLPPRSNGSCIAPPLSCHPVAMSRLLVLTMEKSASTTIGECYSWGNLGWGWLGRVGWRADRKGSESRVAGIIWSMPWGRACLPCLGVACSAGACICYA